MLKYKLPGVMNHSGATAASDWEITESSADRMLVVSAIIRMLVSYLDKLSSQTVTGQIMKSEAWYMFSITQVHRTLYSAGTKGC